MSDNVAITAGAGTTVAADEVADGTLGTVKVQYVKLMDGTLDGTGKATVSASGIYTDPHPTTVRLSVAAAGLTTSVTTYTSGDVLGTELSFTSAVRTSGGTGVIQSATLVDVTNGHVLGAVDLYLFDRASTPAADNAASSWADADMLNCLGVINFPVPTSSALNSIATVPYVGLGIKPNATTLFGVLVTRSANAVFTAATDIQVALMILQD